MMISTKGRYALRVLIDMAEHQTDGYIPLKEIAKRQGISEKYLESIVKLLVKGGVVEGMRGKGGGYRLCKSPDQFTAGYILRLMEGSLAPSRERYAPRMLDAPSCVISENRLTMPKSTMKVIACDHFFFSCFIFFYPLPENVITQAKS